MDKPLTKADIDEARERVARDLSRINTEINSRVVERERLEEERQRLADLMNEFLAAELAALRSRNRSA